MSDEKTKCTLTIHCINVRTNSPEVMASALKAVGDLIGALANPVFGAPPAKIVKPKTRKEVAPK